jgi:hypothetical protein
LDIIVNLGKTMNTASLNLSAREALESSLSFLGPFFKQHWLLAVIYVVLCTLPAFIIGEQDVSGISLDKKVELGLLTIVNMIPGFLFIYYSLREALLKLDPTHSISNKSLPMALWQIFCINILSAIIGVPLLFLFVVPGIWWSTKTNVSFANLLSTNDGPISSIKKSHELMNGRFWQCLGFIVAVSSTVVFITLIGCITIGFFLLIGGALNAFFHEGAGLNKAMMIFRMISPMLAVFTSVIFYYTQAWLYVYLQQETTVPVTTV